MRQAIGLETGTEDALRHLALEVWPARTKAVALTYWVDRLVSRFHEVRAALAAGTVPDFEKLSP